MSVGLGLGLFLVRLFRFSIFCFSSFCSTTPRDWLGRTSSKWPVLCWVGRKIL